MQPKNYKNPKMKTVPKKKFKIDKNQLLAYILAGLIIFWTLASVFGFIAYGRTTKKSTNSGIISASAETITELTNDGAYYIDIPFYTGTTLWDSTRSLTFGGNLQVYMNNEGVGFRYKGQNKADSVSFLMPCIVTTSSSWRHSSLNWTPLIDDYNTITYSPYQRWDYIQWRASWFYNGAKIQLGVFLKFGFNDSNTSNEITMYLEAPYTAYNGYPNISFYCPYLDYPNTDSNLGLSVDMTTYVSAQGFATTDFLKYYDLANLLNNGAVSNYEEGLKQGREEGYNVGFGEGTEYGKDIGYDEGRTAGIAEGKTIGYQEGINDANTYTFTNLLSAVFDVPVRTFSSLFNFEVLGVNLLEFFLALFSAGVILAVIRLFL